MSERAPHHTLRDVIQFRNRNTALGGIIKPERRSGSVAILNGEPLSYNRRVRVDAVVDNLFDTYNPWIVTQLERFGDYLHSEGDHATSDLHVKAQFKDGVHATIQHITSRSSSPVDVEETIVGFAGNFIDMLDTSKQLGAYPRTALMLAARSVIVTPDELISLAAANPDLPIRAVAKAALSNIGSFTPDWFIEKYRTNLEKMKVMRGDYPGLPEDTYAEAIARSVLPTDIVEREQLVSNNHGLDGINGDWVHINGIPHQRYRTANWCTTTTTSMDLHRFGITTAQSEIIDGIFGDYDPLLEFMDPNKGPTFFDIRGFVARTYGLYGQVIGHDTYQNKFRGEIASWPVEVKATTLLQNMLGKGNTAHLRVGPHTVLATGYNAKVDVSEYSNNRKVKEDDKIVYSVIDPMTGFENVWGESELVRRWGKNEDDGYNKDGRFLMMVIRNQPPTKK